MTVFIAALLTSNIIAVKLVSFGTVPVLGDVVLPAAVIVFPLSYIVGDILTEVYGYGAARRAIWLGFLANLLLVVFVYLGGLLPPAGFWEGQDAYETILGFTRRLLVASFAAYLAGEFANSLVLAKLKMATEGRYLFLRTIGSTLVGQGIDSAVFIAIAFVGVLSGGDLARLVLAQWLFKVGYETLATPLTYAVVGFLKRAEGVDVYDRETDFNPLALR